MVFTVVQLPVELLWRAMLCPAIPTLDVALLSVPLIVKGVLTPVVVTLAVAVRVVGVSGTEVTFTLTTLLVAGRMKLVPL